MTKIDHARPILTLIDDLKRQRAQTHTPRATKTEPQTPIKLSGRDAALNIVTHHAACAVLTHVYKYSDVRMVDRLLEGVPDAAQRSRLRVWFAAFGPVDFVGGKVTFRRGAKTTLGDAMAKPFWKFKIKE
jgi:hypothetical protein